MTENQYKEKIKTFINTLQNIFRLLQQESLNKKLYDISEIKEKMDKSIDESYSIYDECYKLLKP